MRALLDGLIHLPQQLLIGGVRAYRFLLKPWLGNACRFEPTCSAYTLQALQQHGALQGAALGGWRLLRCHPWCDGGLDPVPAGGLFGRLGLTDSTERLADPCAEPQVSPRNPP